MQQLAGVGVSMQRVDTRKLEKVLSRPWTADGQTFTARCWTDKDKLVDLMGKELTRMVATGAKPDRAIKNIAHAFETSKANAARVVMTESAFFASAAQKECYADLDVERYEVIGTFDARMCDYCSEMDGKVFSMKDFKEGTTAPPFHPWCRCCTAPYFEDMKDIGERWARDIETGKGYFVPSDMTYEEWKATQDAKHGSGTVDTARKKAYNETADREQYERWKTTLKEEGAKTFDAFQDKKYTAPDEYKQLVDYARYKKRVPEATKEDFQKFERIKQTGVKGTIRVPPSPIDVDSLEFKDEHGLHHGCTLDDAKDYVKNAGCSIRRKKWDGFHTNYYSDYGATYVHDETMRINTAYPQEKFNDDTKAIVEAMK